MLKKKKIINLVDEFEKKKTRKNSRVHRDGRLIRRGPGDEGGGAPLCKTGCGSDGRGTARPSLSYGTYVTFKILKKNAGPISPGSPAPTAPFRDS